MKQIQIEYGNKFQFLKKVKDLRNYCDKMLPTDILFYLTWTKVNDEDVLDAISAIEEFFPEGKYYGNETSGNINMIDEMYGIVLNVYLFDSEKDKVELAWVEKGTELQSLEDLWNYCNSKEGLKAVELIPSLSYLGELQINNNTTKLSEDVLLFGGTSVAYELPCLSAEVVMKGHKITGDGMAVVLYFGEDLHFSSTFVLGWKGLGNSRPVTKSENNIIKEIDNEPAFSIYEKYLNLSSDGPENFIFPLISKEDGTEFIRTPQVVLPDKSMAMFANIPEGTKVRIAYGDKNTILNTIYRKALEIVDFRPELIKIHSCAARRMFWTDDEVNKETGIIEKIAPISGFFTGGEIIRIGNKVKVMNQTLSIISMRENDGSPIDTGIFDTVSPDESLVSRLAYFTGKVSQEQEEALEMAQAANKAKTNFLFNMSHDIRTPLNAIIGFTNIAAREIDDKEKALDCIKKAHDSSDLLLSIINDILDMSRIESGKVILKSADANVLATFNKIEQVMKNLAAVKDIALTFKVEELVHKFVYTDMPFVERVLINIVSNAIKYTLPGGKVDVTLMEDEALTDQLARYIFIVKDNGIGMSKEFQEHMFEEFAREENSTISGIQGTGLGLPLALKLTQFMGGDIYCESERGVGTTFTVEFPFKIKKDEEVNEELKDEGKKIADFHNKRVLLVEDNELNLEIALDILIEEGIKPETAENGKIAVDFICEKGPDYYDFVLMDVQMPVMNGYEATKEIRRLFPNSKLPIIALSANAFAEDKAASVAAGMNDHVAKPINIAELKKVMAKYI